MSRYIYIVFFSFCSYGYSQATILEIIKEQDTVNTYFVNDSSLFTKGCDTLPQSLFWKKIMLLSPDSCVINIARTRQILYTMSFEEWRKQTEDEKQKVRDSLRQLHGLDSNETIFVTTGKNHFYAFEKVLPSISRGVELFELFGVDPWYAQTILLIESPGKLDRYSNVGAYGPFQMMKRVGRKYGLVVNGKVDEREDFDKSAKAASRFISESCIPMARNILFNEGIPYDEKDLWFKLFVLHIYHAGAGNVGALIQHYKPSERGISLIQFMWQNEYAGFKNASQNYSQVALASNLILHEIIHEQYTSFYDCSKFRIN